LLILVSSLGIIGKAAAETEADMAVIKWRLFIDKTEIKLMNTDDFGHDAYTGISLLCHKNVNDPILWGALSGKQRKYIANQLANDKGIFTKVIAGLQTKTCWGEKAVRYEWEDENESYWEFQCGLSVSKDDPFFQEFARTGEISVEINGSKETNRNWKGRNSISKFVELCSRK
jgi:hypothetical protein